MKTVIDGVIPLRVPAVVVLIHTIAVDPQDGGMPFGAIQVFRRKEPAGNLLAIGSWVVDELRLDKLRAVGFRRHGAREPDGLRACARAAGEKIGAVVRIGVLVDETRVTIGPVWLRIRARA